MTSHRSTTVLSIFLLLAISAAGLVVAARLLVGSSVPLVSERSVAILPVLGVIDSDREFLRNLKTFRENGAVRAFVLEIRSPGGGVGPSQSMYRELRKLRDTDDRPVIAWIGGVGASGGYYISLAADSIFVLPGSITGSIGVVMEFPNARELLRKVGLGFEVVKSGEHKDMGSPARPLSEEDRRILQGVVDDVFNQFVDAVAQNRPLGRDTVLALADGRIFSGERAVDLRLADRIATLPEAISAAGRMAGLGENPRTLRPSERRVGLLDVLGGISESRLVGWLRALTPSTGGTPSLRYEWP
ncbi:MAG: signal peptide peptidase SppA [Gemmatimonadota bacterium]